MSSLRPAVIGTVSAHQVAFCGPLGVGKTTAVQAASDVPVVSTEAPRALTRLSSAELLEKRTTTVGIDYGEWHSDEHGCIAIYGTPGQSRFTTMRESALGANINIVLWLHGHNSWALEEASEWLGYIGGPTIWPRLTVAVTRLKHEETCGPGATTEHPALIDYRQMLDEFFLGIPVIAADPRVGSEVRTVLDLSIRLRQASSQKGF